MSTISSSTTNTTALNFTADTTGKLVVQTGSTPTTAVTIDGSQNVNVGSATQIGAEKLGISFDDSTLNGLGLQVQGSSSGAGYVAFRNSSGSLIGSISRNGTASSLKFNTTSSGTTGAYLLDSGVAFPATQVTSSDANTLDDYEEGTWTPTDNSGAGLSLSISGATYVKIGQLVIAWTQINYPSTANGNGASIAGLPFTVAGQDIYGGFTRYSTYGYAYPTLAQSGTYGSLYTTTGSQITNANLSSKRVDFTYVYRSNA